jgi:hypothetical protein
MTADHGYASTAIMVQPYATGIKPATARDAHTSPNGTSGPFGSIAAKNYAPSNNFRAAQFGGVAEKLALLRAIFARLV